MIIMAGNKKIEKKNEAKSYTVNDKKPLPKLDTSEDAKVKKVIIKESEE